MSELNENADIVNLTPYPLTLVKKGENGEWEEVRYWDRGEISLCLLEGKEVAVEGEVDGIEVAREKYGPGKDVPEPEEGIYFVVPILVAQVLKRPDFLVPNTVRDEEGQIIGCDSFSRILE